MELNDIENLLARYYQGTADETEEQTLRRFFAEKEVPESLLAEKHYFRLLDALQKAEVPVGLEERLSVLIDEWEAGEKRVLVAKHRRLGRLQWIGSIAAGLLLLFGTGMYLHRSAPSARQDTCVTPEEAYVQAQKALVLFSSQLNKGMKEMELMQKTTEKIRENVNGQFNRINDIKQ